MNRTEFMNRLERLLWDIPESERREALQYYNDYFDDAGPENEARVIRELGSPAQVAKTIREGMSENGEYTKHGYEDARFRNRQDVAADDPDIVVEKSFERQRRNSPDPWKLLAIFLLCLLLLPIIIPLFLVLLAVPASILIGIIGIVIAAMVAAAALPVAGIVLLAIAFYHLFLTPVAGITLGGIGLVLLAAGILTFLLTIWILKAVFPVCIRTVVAMLRYPLRKAGIVK